MASHIDHVASFILYGEQTFLYAERCGGVEPTCWKVVNSWPLPGSCPLLVTRLALGERDPLWVLGRDAPHALKLEQSCGKFPRLRFVSFECRLGDNEVVGEGKMRAKEKESKRQLGLMTFAAVCGSSSFISDKCMRDTPKHDVPS